MEFIWFVLFGLIAVLFIISLLSTMSIIILAWASKSFEPLEPKGELRSEETESKNR